jgi:hypothetical protein
VANLALTDLRIFYFRLELRFSLGAANLEQLGLFFKTDLNLVLTGPFFGKYKFGVISYFRNISLIYFLLMTFLQVPARFLLFEI